MRLSFFSIILHHTYPHSLTSFVLTVLLYIHRQYFTRVMTENPNNPLDSPYAASVLATFRCAVTVLQVIRNCLIKQPILMARFWLCWSQLMTSAVSTSLGIRSTFFHLLSVSPLLASILASISFCFRGDDASSLQMWRYTISWLFSKRVDSNGSICFHSSISSITHPFPVHPIHYSLMARLRLRLYLSSIRSSRPRSALEVHDVRLHLLPSLS